MRRLPKSIHAVLFPGRYPAFPRVADAAALETLWAARPDAVLANLAHAAYHDEATVGQLVTRLGGALLRFLDRRGAEGFLAEWPHRAVLAFRGTEPLSPGDLIADLRILKRRFREARVHRGFDDRLELLWELIEPRLGRLRDGGTPVSVTGHSLGGAMATLAGCRWAFDEVVTFGEPRVGLAIDEAFESGRHARYVNGRDPIPALPPRWAGYRHHGDAIRIADPDGPSVRYDHGIVYYAEVVELSSNSRSPR